MSKLIINTNRPGSTINKNIYGHFSEHLGRCIYGGIFVGEDSPIPNIHGIRTDVVEALKHIQIPVLRWPGGCFADEYHWKDGIGPKETRKKMINSNWGGVVEDNSFGTHEFLELCALLGCEPYVNANVGSGTVQEMSEWVEYMNFDGISPMTELRRKNGREEPWGVKFLGIGNENWGCGGNMRPQHYADLYRQFSVFVRTYGENRPFKIACGPNVDDYRWTQVLMENYVENKHPHYMDALTLHMYTVPTGVWRDKGAALDFSDDLYYRTIKHGMVMDELIENHKRIMNRYDPEHKVGLIVDEWGAWYNVEPGTNPRFLYQQNTMRDALLAAVTLNIFNAHCDRVIMANLAQTVNVLQSVILTEGDRMLLTPTYHVFDLYKEHQDATLLDSYAETSLVGPQGDQIPDLHLSASRKEDGAIHITLANLSLTEAKDVDAFVAGTEIRSAKARILTGDVRSYNSFEAPETVKPAEFDAITWENGCLKFTIPPCSVMAIRVNA